VRGECANVPNASVNASARQSDAGGLFVVEVSPFVGPAGLVNRRNLREEDDIGVRNRFRIVELQKQTTSSAQAADSRRSRQRTI